MGFGGLQFNTLAMFNCAFGYQLVDYGKHSAILIQTVKEQQHKVQYLKEIIPNLKSKVDSLELK